MSKFLILAIFTPLVFLNSCASLLPIADDIEKIANNDAITIKCDKDALSQNTNVHIVIDVVNVSP